MNMIRLQRTDGSLSEEPRATTASFQGDYVVCRDELGRLVATYERGTVVAFGDETLKTSSIADASGPVGEPNPRVGQKA